TGTARNRAETHAILRVGPGSCWKPGTVPPRAWAGTHAAPALALVRRDRGHRPGSSRARARRRLAVRFFAPSAKRTPGGPLPLHRAGALLTRPAALGRAVPPRSARPGGVDPAGRARKPDDPDLGRAAKQPDRPTRARRSPAADLRTGQRRAPRDPAGLADPRRGDHRAREPEPDGVGEHGCPRPTGAGTQGADGGNRPSRRASGSPREGDAP